MAQPQAPTDMEGQMSAAGLPDPAKAWMRVHPEYWTDRAKNSEINTLHGYLTNNKRIKPFSEEYFDELESELGLRSAAGGFQAAQERQPEMPRRSVPYAREIMVYRGIGRGHRGLYEAGLGSHSLAHRVMCGAASRLNRLAARGAVLFFYHVVLTVTASSWEYFVRLQISSQRTSCQRGSCEH
jgi:hypothetical protein